MSQTSVTDFFSARKKAPDQHAAKRRKILQETTLESNEVIDAKSVVTSATDGHAVAPKTPSTTSKDVENGRSSKRASVDLPPPDTTPEGNKVQRFTQGAPPTSSAKKKLDLGKERPKRNVPFTKLAPMSPKKTTKSILGGEHAKSEQPAKFKVPTPVKELVGARRGNSARNFAAKNLFQDDEEKAARPRRGAAAKLLEEETAVLAKVNNKVKKMTPEEVKEKIGKVKSKDELLAALKNLKKDTNKIKQIKSKREPTIPPASPQKSGLTVEVPVSPRKARVPPPHGEEKVSPRKMPAYQRFSTLTRPIEQTRTLALPWAYRQLEEVFQSTDSVVSMYFNRGENVTLEKLAPSCQTITKKNFGLKQLGQIKNVFPQAYFYKWNKIKNKFGSDTKESEMMITPNLDYKTSILCDLGAAETMAAKQEGKKLKPNMLIERGHIFHNSLLQLVRDQHRTFLESIGISSVDETKLTAWHKDFPLSQCREIDTADLPAKPEVEKFLSAKAFLAMANNIPAEAQEPQPLTTGGSQSSAQPAKPGDAAATQSSAAVSTSSSAVKATSSSTAAAPEAVASPAVSKALKGINSKLLEKIRAKEAKQAVIEMTRDQSQIKRISMLKRLPNLARTTRSLFVHERKSSLLLDHVIKKLVQSYPGHVSYDLLEEDLRALVVETGSWFKLEKVGVKPYLMIDKCVEITAMVSLLEKSLKEAESK